MLRAVRVHGHISELEPDADAVVNLVYKSIRKSRHPADDREALLNAVRAGRHLDFDLVCRHGLVAVKLIHRRQNSAIL